MSKTWEYRDSKSLTKLISIFIVIGIISCLIILIAAIKINNDLPSFTSFNTNFDLDKIVIQNYTIMKIIDKLEVVVSILTVIIFFTYLFWIYYLNSNTRALGITSLKQTPGWAVGWHFIPFLCFIIPFLVIKEIWLANTNLKNNNIYITLTLLAFYLFYFITILLGSSISTMLDSDFDPIYIKLIYFITIINSLFRIIVGILLLTIVNKIQKGQTILANSVFSQNNIKENSLEANNG